MKEWFKRITGITRLERDRAEALGRAKEAELREAAAVEAEAIAKMSPKERATKKGEPWVAVLDTKVNIDNPRNGFFEQDWNVHFIEQLKKSGYGFDGDLEEEIVDRWFRDLARNMLSEDGLDSSRGAGFINVNRIGGGRAEVV